MPYKVNSITFIQHFPFKYFNSIQFPYNSITHSIAIPFPKLQFSIFITSHLQTKLKKVHKLNSNPTILKSSNTPSPNFSIITLPCKLAITLPIATHQTISLLQTQNYCLAANSKPLPYCKLRTISLPQTQNHCPVANSEALPCISSTEFVALQN